MPKFRKKPVVIEAESVANISIAITNSDGPNGRPWLALPAWLRAALRVDGAAPPKVRSIGGGRLLVDTLEGEMLAEPNDFIVCGVEGEIYPVKPGIFAKTYDLAWDATKVTFDPDDLVDSIGEVDAPDSAVFVSCEAAVQHLRRAFGPLEYVKTIESGALQVSQWECRTGARFAVATIRADGRSACGLVVS